MNRTTCTEPQCLFKGALYLLFIHESLTKTQTGFQTMTFDSATSTHKLIFVHFRELVTVLGKVTSVRSLQYINHFMVSSEIVYVRFISKVL